MCDFEDEIKPPSAKHCSNGVAVKAKNKRLLLDTAFVLAITNRASPLYSQYKTDKIQTAIPCECLLGEGALRTQADKRLLIRSVLILLCLFKDGTRAAAAARKASVELDD